MLKTELQEFVQKTLTEAEAELTFTCWEDFQLLFQLCIQQKLSED